MEMIWIVGILVAMVIIALVLRPRRKQDLRGKVVLLTGAGGGLGRQLALILASRGCSVACVDVATAPNEETARLVLQQQERQQRQHEKDDTSVARAYTVDLSKKENITALVQKVIEDFGKIDILINNAAQLQGGAIWELTVDQIEAVLAVNLRASLLLIHAVMPHMKARRSGHLVAISSVAAHFSTRSLNVYAATKAAVSQSMNCMYHDLRYEGLHNNIHATSIHPFFMSTFSRIQQAVSFGGPIGKLLFSFLDPKDAAEQAVQGIVEMRRRVFIPGFLLPFLFFYRLMPLSMECMFYDYIVPVSQRPPFSYQYRHEAMNPDILHELLCKGYPLEEDPEGVCKDMQDRYTAKGHKLPHNFAEFSSTMESFYRSRKQDVPSAVRHVFGIAS